MNLKTLKMVLVISIWTAICTSSYGTVTEKTLAKADSLFKLKQYTQSLELYQSLFNQKMYSPSMLLKIAYIQEGLGRIGPSLYYLNLYYLATDDEQAQVKIESVAVKNRLEGYSETNTTRFSTFLHENQGKIAAILASLGVLLLAWMFFQKVKRYRRPIGSFIALIVTLTLLFASVYYSRPNQGIIASPATYLMSGPSAGSSVVGIVGEGHRLEIIGHEDVWLKVMWIDKEAFVKKSELLLVEI